MQVQELLTMKDVCKLLNVSHDTIEKEIKDMRLAGTKIRREWRFTREAIADYLESRTMKVNRRKPQTFKA